MIQILANIFIVLILIFWGFVSIRYIRSEFKNGGCAGCSASCSGGGCHGCKGSCEGASEMKKVEEIRRNKSHI